jgi:D-alanyl-D-alanine carboxypeptidase
MSRFLGIFAALLSMIAVHAQTPPQPTSDAFVETAFRLGIPRDYAHVRGMADVREPQQLTAVGGRDALGYALRLMPEAARAWTRMRAAAARDGIDLRAVSTFRSVEVQLAIVRAKLARGQTIEAILRVSAAPGYSEHHSGRAIDITTPGYAPTEEEFERSPAFAWLTQNAEFHGFRMSYPRGNRHAIAYEPWHWYWQQDDSPSACNETEFVTAVAADAQVDRRYAKQ